MGWLNIGDSYDVNFARGTIAEIFAKANFITSVDLIHHGRWIRCHPGSTNVFCSECGTLGTHVERYCPNCWSKMDGGDTRE